MPDTAPTTTTGNPFSLIAQVLFKLRHELEEVEPDRPARWVRIARGREAGSTPLMGFVASAVGGLADTLSYMAELTLDIEELLIQTDAAKAIAENALDLISAATSPNFVAGINALLGTSNASVDSVFSEINQAAQQINDFLGYIPEPHDVRQLGHELYRLLCIVQQPLPRNAQGQLDTSLAQATDLGGEAHLDLERTGKARLCAWAYARAVTVRGLGANEAQQREVTRLGTRRLFVPGAAGMASRARMSWSFEGREIVLFDLTFEMQVNDIAELVALLKAHGYNDPPMADQPTTMTSEIVGNLMRFQHLNELPLTGLLDEHTLNRLFNLDFARKNLLRAVPYSASTWPWAGTPSVPLHGELTIVNGDADQPERENRQIERTLPLPYYVVGSGAAAPAAPPAGWFAESAGFVALASRPRSTNSQARYTGGIWSEGEAAQGNFFWAARHIEPWKDGRHGTPDDNALFGGSRPDSGTFSRMFQWIPRPSWLDPATPPPQLPGAHLYVYATVLQRSLWSDRDSSGHPDQGLIQLEAHPAGVGRYSNNYTMPTTIDSMVSTESFPTHTAIAASDQLAEIDRRRWWSLRRTPDLEVTAAANIAAFRVVLQGLHKSAHDTDAYFDDVRVYYQWRLPGSGT